MCDIPADGADNAFRHDHTIRAKQQKEKSYIYINIKKVQEKEKLKHKRLPFQNLKQATRKTFDFKSKQLFFYCDKTKSTK